MTRRLAALAVAVSVAAPPVMGQDVVFASFDESDMNLIDPFTATGEGIETGFLGSVDGETGEETNALVVEIDPALAGTNAGVVVRSPDGAVDASEADSVVVRIWPRSVDPTDLPLTVDIDVRVDADGDGRTDGLGGTSFDLPAADDYVEVVLPLDFGVAFPTFGPSADADDPDFERVLEVGLSVGLRGVQKTFEVAIDEVAFRARLPRRSRDVRRRRPTRVRRRPPLVAPTPTAGGAAVAFSLVAPSDVTVEVLDLLGRRLAATDLGWLPAGRSWAALPVEGLPAGLYLVSVRTAGGAATARLTVAR